MTHRDGDPTHPGDPHACVLALLDDNAEDLYENAPCGYLSTLPDGRIAKINATLLDWLGYRRDELVGRRYFSDLLTVGGRMYHETHFAPLLRMRGQISGIALELKAADGTRLSVLVTSTVKLAADGQPALIRTTIFDARERRAYEAELLRARREAERDRERLQRSNAALQQTLLPAALEPIPGVEISAHYHMASVDEVGGDFYDVFPVDAQSWGFFLGDVCGKGVAAAAVTALARYTLRGAAIHDPDPAAVLAHLNTVMVRGRTTGLPRFCTAIYGQLVLDRDRPGAAVTLAAGGHPWPILLRGNGSAEYLPTPGGQLIGVFDDATIATVTVALRPGDTLLLYSDGIIEARTGGGLFGESALLDFARALAPVSAERAVTALTELLESFGTAVTDDTAVLALHIPPVGA